MRRVLTCVALVVLVLLQVPTALADTRNAQSAPPVYLVIDVSGSMEGQRLVAAQKAAQEFIRGLQPDQIMALYTFPGGHRIVDGCSPGSFSIRPQRFNQGNAQFAINMLAASGNTPTVPALKEIMRSVKNNGYEHAQVVLVTDGEANCGASSDVCSIVPLLDQQGVALRIHTVSLNNTPTGDASLACLAKATGGSSTTIDNVDGLVDAVKKNSSYAATLDVRAPDTMSRVTGRARELAPQMEITVTGVGSAQIPDASLVVTFSSGDAARRVDLDPDGIVPLGNIDSGRSILRRFTLYPMATTGGPVTWKATVNSGGIPVASKTGTVQLTSDTTVDSAGSILREAKHVVVLGDSYSSGEGGGNYDGASDSRIGLCHRSANAYGRILFADVTMLACSGATTTDMVRYNSKDGYTKWVEPQLFELLKLTASDNTPDLVFMTLGGNDSGFADVVSGFVTSSTAADAPPLRPAMEWATLQTRLVDSYAKINAVVNASMAVAKRSGKVAQIVILPYVRPLPKAGGDGCFSLISQRELDLANDFATSLNETVRSAVAEAAGAGAPIQLASPVEYAFQPDHTICDGAGSDANTISFDNTSSTAAALWRAMAGSQRQELMHPNAAGYHAVAASLVEWSRTVSPKPLGKTPVDYRGINVRLYKDSNVSWDKQTKLGESGITVNLPGFVTEPGATVSATLCIEACEFGSTYILVTSYSTPIPLGSLPVSPDTHRPEGRIVLPDNLAPGEHTIVLRGYDKDGNPHEASFNVIVWRPGTNLGIYLAIAGAACLIVGLGMTITRRLLARTRVTRDSLVAR